MEFKFRKDIYPQSALIKAAYHFTDIAYIHLDADDQYFLVNLSLKEGNILDPRDFENEILAQTARYEILRNTRDIRTIALARAMGSSVIDEANTPAEEEMDGFSVNDVLKDWFEQ